MFGTVYMFPYAAEAVAYTVGTPLLGVLGPRWLFVLSGVGVLATLAVVHQLISAALRPRLGV